MPLTPAATLRVIDSLAIVLSRAYQLARCRLAAAASPVLRLTIERDHLHTEVALLERELAVLRASRAGMKPLSRPDFALHERLEVVQIMRLRGWFVAEGAQRFVVHPNTLGRWVKALQQDGPGARLFVAPSWNRIHDAVRWATQELRRLFPEPEFGTRTIASHLARAAVQVSRSTVQRVLREPELPKPATSAKMPLIPPAGALGKGLLRPKRPNRVWHTDLTVFRIAGIRQ